MASVKILEESGPIGMRLDARERLETAIAEHLEVGWLLVGFSTTPLVGNASVRGAAASGVGTESILYTAILQRT